MWLFRTGDFGPAVLTINYLLFLSPVKLVQIHAYKVLGWDPHVSPPSSFNKRGVRCCPGDWRFKASRVTVTPLPCLVGEEGIEPSRSETVDLQSTEPTALLNSPEDWWRWRVMIPLPSRCKRDALPIELHPLWTRPELHGHSRLCGSRVFLVTPRALVLIWSNWPTCDVELDMMN